MYKIHTKKISTCSEVRQQTALNKKKKAKFSYAFVKVIKIIKKKTITRRGENWDFMLYTIRQEEESAFPFFLLPKKNEETCHSFVFTASFHSYFYSSFRMHHVIYAWKRHKKLFSLVYTLTRKFWIFNIHMCVWMLCKGGMYNERSCKKMEWNENACISWVVIR